MQQHHDFNRFDAQVVGWNLRILLLTGALSDPLAAKVASLGGPVEVETELNAGIAAMIDDPTGYGLLVVDCDAFGGVEAGERILTTLAAVGATLPKILISRAFQAQIFPDCGQQPVRLRGPISALSLRIGCEHALRDRLLWRAAS